MTTVAEFTIPADEFPLGSVFDGFPEAVVELERVVPTNAAIVPYFWIQGVEKDTELEIEDAFRDHPDVRAVRTVDEVDGEFLKRVDWGPDYQGVLRAIAETGVTLLSGIGTAERWDFQIRAEDRDDVAAFQRYCRDHDVPVEVTALRASERSGTVGNYDLTDTQREAMVLAYERGYFDSPRQATLAEIAADLDITRQSLASRLRRGHRRLIRSTLVGSRGFGGT